MMMKKISDWFLILGFALFLAAVAAGTLARAGETASYYENRTLAAVPAASGASLRSGAYFDDWETFFTDHAAGRDALLRLNVRLRRTAGQPVVDEVYWGPEALLPYVAADRPDDGRIAARAENLADGLSELAALVESYGGRFLYVGVPEQSTYFADQYPVYLRDGQRTRAAERAAFAAALAERNVDLLDLGPVFAASGRTEELYFRTDHHYTVFGALTAYEAIGDRLALPALGRGEWTLATLPQPFLGSRNRRLYGLYESADALTYAVPAVPIPFTRTDDGAAADSAVIALPEDGAPVTYEAFMGGDHGETVLSTGRPALPDALIYGDSFTNALETLLYTAFDETRSLDLRHYTAMTLREYIAEHRPDVVICLRDDSNYLTPTGNGRTD